MELNTNREYDLYNDIKQRCKGEIYIGVVGPVRTGKSTFIKRFMEEMVLPNMSDEFEKERAVDELPQSAGGKTVTTTEPKFIPKEAARIKIQEGMEASVRLIDCVGYMVEGAAGHMEDSAERMVKTPWAKEEIPFTKAAEIGTRKVIQDHSTIGIVVTCDGSFGEIERENYIKAEEQTIKELKKLKKPFVVLMNTVKPYGEEVRQLSKELAEKYETEVLIMTGFLDGINESLKGYENPIDTMAEDTVVKIEIDPEKLYYNMVEAKASWLYELPQWSEILSAETRTELYKKQKASGTVRRQGHKIYPNDPCPCGSGKKYKQCCGRNAAQ